MPTQSVASIPVVVVMNRSERITHYARLLGIKRRYDPDGLFFAHHGVGSEDWTDDGFARRP